MLKLIFNTIRLLAEAIVLLTINVALRIRVAIIKRSYK
jgi:hypothetical protein